MAGHRRAARPIPRLYERIAAEARPCSYRRNCPKDKLSPTCPLMCRSPFPRRDRHMYFGPEFLPPNLAHGVLLRSG
jgi:hypothetical protein